MSYHNEMHDQSEMFDENPAQKIEVVVKTESVMENKEQERADIADAAVKKDEAARKLAHTQQLWGDSTPQPTLAEAQAAQRKAAMDNPQVDDTMDRQKPV